MKVSRLGGEFGPPRLRVEDLSDPRAATAALERWDDLDPGVRQALETHPRHGPRLRKLKAAERWLRTESSGEHRDPGPCPASAELYDFGRGPGYAQLSASRRAEIEVHLVRCPDCEFFVETLVAPPPVPIDVAPAHEPAPLPTPVKVRVLRTRSWIPLAVAASLVAALGLWRAFSADSTGRPAFPESPLLRGAAGGPLLFPRDRILLPSEAALAAWPVLGQPPVFEVEAQPEAADYRVEIARHDGSAFAANEVVSKLHDARPTLTGTSVLAAGHYTWDAWALVRGLEQHLGARDFEAAPDTDLSAKLVKIADERGPDRTLAAVRLLHESGCRTQARALARTMPASAERDSYLGQAPGR